MVMYDCVAGYGQIKFVWRRHDAFFVRSLNVLSPQPILQYILNNCIVPVVISKQVFLYLRLSEEIHKIQIFVLLNM
jgi:hypothetical protein